MQLTKGAIGNLIAKYKAVLKKCHILNVFGTLAVGGMLLVGGFTNSNADPITIDETDLSKWDGSTITISQADPVTITTNSNEISLKTSSGQADPDPKAVSETGGNLIILGTNKGAATLTIDSNFSVTGTTKISGASNNLGTITVSGGNFSATGEVTVGDYGVLNVADTVTATEGITLNGTNSANLIGLGGTISGAVTATKGNIDLSSGNLTISNKLSLTENGTVTYSTDNTLQVASLTLGDDHNVSGNLAINVSGEESSYLSGGKDVTIADGGIVTVTGNADDENYTGSGNLIFSGGTSADNSSVTYSLGKFTVGTVTMDNAAVTSGQIVVGGSEDGATELTAGAVSMTTSAAHSTNLILSVIGENDKLTVASLAVSGSGSTNTATLDIKPNAGNVVVSGTTAINKAGVLNIGSGAYTGTVTLAGAVTVAASGSLTANQGMVVAASTTTINGEATFAGLTLDSTADATAGNYVAQDNVTISGAGAIVEVDSLTINDKTLTVETSGSLTSSGGLTMTGGTLTVTSGSATFNNSATERSSTISSGAITVNAGGAVTFAQGAQITGGTVTLNGTGKLDFNGDTEITGGTVSVADLTVGDNADNSTLTISREKTLTISDDAKVNATGALTVQSGNLSVSTLTLATSATASSGGELAVRGNATVSGSGVLTAESINVTTSTLTVNSGTVNSPAINITAANAATAALTLKAGSTINGQINVTKGTVALSGSVTLAESEGEGASVIALNGSSAADAVLKVTHASGALSENSVIQVSKGTINADSAGVTVGTIKATAETSTLDLANATNSVKTSKLIVESTNTLNITQSNGATTFEVVNDAAGDFASGGGIVAVGDNVSIAFSGSGAALEGNDIQFTINGTTANAANTGLTFKDGTYNGIASVKVDNASGAVNANNGATVSVDALTVAGSTGASALGLNVSGSGVVKANTVTVGTGTKDAVLTVAATNGATGNVTVSGSAGLTTVGAKGALTLNGNSVAYTTTSLQSSGAVNVTDGLLKVGSGGLTVNGGTLTQHSGNGGVLVAGKTSIAGGNVTVHNFTLNTDQANASPTATNFTAAGEFDVSEGKVWATGTTALTKGTLKAAEFTLSNTAPASFNAIGDGEFYAVSNSVTIAADAILDADTVSVSSGSLTVNGTINGYDGESKSTVNIEANAVTNGTLNVSGGGIVNGDVNVTTGTLAVAKGTIIGDVTLNGSSAENSVLRIDNSDAAIEGSISVNRGIVNLNGNTLTMNEALELNATDNSAASAVLKNSDNANLGTLDGSVTLGYGTVTDASGSIAITGILTVNSHSVIDSAATNTITVGSLTLTENFAHTTGMGDLTIAPSETAAWLTADGFTLTQGTADVWLVQGEDANADHAGTGTVALANNGSLTFDNGVYGATAVSLTAEDAASTANLVVGSGASNTQLNADITVGSTKGNVAQLNVTLKKDGILGDGEKSAILVGSSNK